LSKDKEVTIHVTVSSGLARHTDGDTSKIKITRQRDGTFRRSDIIEQLKHEHFKACNVMDLRQRCKGSSVITIDSCETLTEIIKEAKPTAKKPLNILVMRKVAPPAKKNGKKAIQAYTPGGSSLVDATRSMKPLLPARLTDSEEHMAFAMPSLESKVLELEFRHPGLKTRPADKVYHKWAQMIAGKSDLLHPLDPEGVVPSILLDTSRGVLDPKPPPAPPVPPVATFHFSTPDRAQQGDVVSDQANGPLCASNQAHGHLSAPLNAQLGGPSSEVETHVMINGFQDDYGGPELFRGNLVRAIRLCTLSGLESQWLEVEVRLGDQTWSLPFKVPYSLTKLAPGADLVPVELPSSPRIWAGKASVFRKPLSSTCEIPLK
jgi:hypothetical protein